MTIQGSRPGKPRSGTDPASPTDEDTAHEVVTDDPKAFEDYDEFNGDNDASPDDRRRDPLRKN